ncbi:MAG: ROK family protein [Micrococcus sp.]|nr:ROK family protein [Micrococcus sp.]
MGGSAGRAAPVAAALGLDVGGGAVKAGAVLLDARGRLEPFLSEVRVNHHLEADGAGLTALCARTARDLFGRLDTAWPGLPVVWGVSAAAWIDPDSGAAVFSPHLMGWRHRPLPADLGAALAKATGLPLAAEAALPRPLDGVPVPAVVNDADAAAWAEARLGDPGMPSADPARPARPDRMVMVAIGTGIGGALVQDGAVDIGAHGMAGEYGHMTVDPSGLPCPCGNTGCWELLVSAEALAARAGHASARPALDDALSGDPRGVRAVQETGRWLGRGLATLAAVLDPTRFVIGGGVAVAGDLLLDPARAELARHIPGGRRRPVPPVTVASLGNRAGWLGAAGVALERAGWSVTGSSATGGN